MDRALALAPDDVDVETAWNPEFLREGFAVHDTCTPTGSCLACNEIRYAPRPRSANCTPAARPGCAVPADRPADRRIGQGVGECLLATKISFINAISEVCEAVDDDVTLLADALGYDSRMG